MARNYYNTRKNRHWGIYIAIAVIAAAATWRFWPDDRADDADGPAPVSTTQSADDAESRKRVSVLPVNRTGNNRPTTRTAAKSDPKALKKYQAGIAAFNVQKNLEARGLLSEAVISGGLAGNLAADARERLAYLSKVTLFARTIDPRDPYTMRYTFKSGETPAGVERKLKLHVPAQLMVKINALPDASKFRAGADYKLIKGPFHAIVYKSIFKMDLYLWRKADKLPTVFIKRYDVGLGKNDSTPVGRWRLGCGALVDANGKRERGKLLRAAWNPPPNSGSTPRIEYNMPGYPFGSKGMWISLVGTDKNTRKLTDYGIHSTNDPSTISKQSSLGCIRMRDNDIQEVYDRLYEKWSTVEVLP